MRSLLIVLAVVGLATKAHAVAGCESEADAPEIHDAESWKAYKRWCAACNGEVADSLDVAQKEGGCLLPSAPASPAAGGPMDEHIAKAIVAGVNGDISAGDALVLGGAGLIINSLLAPSSKNPAAEEAAIAAQAAEQQRVLEAQKAESAQRLLDGMMLDEESPQVVSEHSGEPGDLSSQLMTDDPAGSTGGEESIMARRRTRLRPRYQPGAVQTAQGKYTPPRSLTRDELMKDRDGPAPARTPPPVVAAAGAALPPLVDRVGYRRGLAHGMGCFSRSAGPACTGVTQAEAPTCVDDYNNGYATGDGQAKQRIRTAFRNGQQDRAANIAARGARDADGDCNREIRKAYDDGFAGRPPP